MKINSHSIRSIQIQLQVGVKLSEIEVIQNSFDLIPRFAIRLIFEYVLLQKYLAIEMSLVVNYHLRLILLSSLVFIDANVVSSRLT